jgi:hypothetical protein
VLELRRGRAGRQGIPADGSALGLALMRKKKGEVSEGSFCRGFIEWCRAAERETLGVRPTTD